MNNIKIKYFLLLLASTFTAAIGQLLFKYSFTFSNLTLLGLWLLAGLVAYGISTVVYFIVLSRAHLSWTYGVGGLSYIFATIFAYAILMENIPLLRWVGVLIIFIGVAIIGLS